jgi:hypothetical protein
MRTADALIDRPFFPQEVLTPLSSSPSRSISPFTPNDGSRPPFGRPLRSATAPVYRGPPSPELLSSNLDCAFPPFLPTKPAKSKPQLAGGYGSMGGDSYAEPDPTYAPVSPRTATSGGLLHRMNTIAPGPFDVNSRRKVGSPEDQRGHQRQATLGSMKDMVMAPQAAEIGASIQRPVTAEGHSRTSKHSSNGSRSGFGLPKQPRKDGYGGFGKPSAATDGDTEQEPLRAGQRSQTFPLPSPSQEQMFRRPSEPDTRMRRPSNESARPMGNERSISGSPPRQRKQSILGPDLTRPLPPRGASLIRPRTAAGDVPPIPANINLAAEFGIGNPYHTPSESQSSDASGYSQESKASSRSSPPSAADRHRRQPSDTSKFDGLMAEVQASMMALQPKELPSIPSAPSPQRKEQSARALLPPRNLDPSLLSPESPMDPAIQGGRLAPIPPRNPARTGDPVSPPKEKPIRRPTTSKGNCKGCGEAIRGKSVSSADGRLTGRYHKQCFVCQTCSEPFQTATFYVHNDSPYCERHYHKLNGSVCTTCDKGIEGQYLEGERNQKFHPDCLTCSDCKRLLRSDYFEVNGRVFCERDAWRRTQQKHFLGPRGGGPSSNRMERRTTRLMMM